MKSYTKKFQDLLERESKIIMKLNIGDEYILNGTKVLLKNRYVTIDSLGMHIHCEWDFDYEKLIDKKEDK